MNHFYVYILANRKDGDIYTGFTNDLASRVSEHKSGIIEGFTKDNGIHNLVYYEEHDDIHKAAIREKQIKKWYRKWKINLIEKIILNGRICFQI
jgi:putative endonuclease